MDSTNTRPPFFGPTQPLYPQVAESVRVTSGTVPGPQGYGSSSLIAANLYLGYVQQIRTTDLLPRDRIPCLVDDLNGTGLTPGYYSNARLSGNFNGLPVYAVTCCASTGGGSGGALFIQTNTTTTIDATPLASVVGVGVGSMTLPAGFWTVGRAIRITAYGIINQGTFNPGDVQWAVSLQGSSIPSDVVGTGSDCLCRWILDMILRCKAVGSGTTIVEQAGRVICYDDQTGHYAPSNIFATAGFLTAGYATGILNNLDSTTSMLVDVLFSFSNSGGAGHNNVEFCQGVVLEDLRVALAGVGGSGGLINSGIINQLAYYAANGNTLSPLTLGTNLSITGGVLNAATGVSGLPTVVASGDVTAQSSTVSPLATYTVGATIGAFRVGGYVNILSISASTLTFQVLFTDENNASQTLTLTSPQGALTTTGWFLFPDVQIRCKASTTITLRVSAIVVAVSFDCGGTIEQLR